MYYIIQHENGDVRISRTTEIGPREELKGEESRKKDALSFAKRLVEDYYQDRINLLEEFYHED